MRLLFCLIFLISVTNLIGQKKKWKLNPKDWKEVKKLKKVKIDVGKIVEVTLSTSGDLVFGAVEGGANFIGLDNILIEAGKASDMISEGLILVPVENILIETSSVVWKVNDEIERGIENGTIKYIAIAIASYYMAGPLVFELVGWSQVGGGALIFLGATYLTGDDKPTETVEEAIARVNKTIEPFINEITNFICKSLGKDPTKNCNFSFTLQGDYSEEVKIGLGDDYREYYDYYKGIQDNSFEFFSNYLGEKRLHDQAVSAIIFNKGFDDLIANELIDASNQYFLIMHATSSLLNSKKSFSPMEAASLLELYNDANINYKATQYIFLHKFQSLEEISNNQIREVIEKWTMGLDNEFLNNGLIKNHTIEKRNEYANRAPSGMLTYMFVGSAILTGIAMFDNVYTLIKTDKIVEQYLDIYNKLPDTEKKKYINVPGRLIMLNIRSGQNATIGLAKLYPEFFNMISLPSKASITVDAASRVFQYIQSENYIKDVNAIDKELKEIDKQLNEIKK